MKEYYVRDWMTADPITVSPNTTIHQAHQIMQKANIRHLPVIASGKLISLITLNDIRRAELELAAVYKDAGIQELVHQLKSVAEIMEDDPLTTLPQATISEAASLMLERKLSALPVIDGDRLVGIITEADIFRFVAQLRITSATKKEKNQG